MSHTALAARHDPTAPLAKASTVAYLAVSPHGGANVYISGAPCTNCTTIPDPLRRPAPCKAPREHALNAVANWSDFAHGGHVQRVEITATGTPAEQAAAARRAAGLALFDQDRGEWVWRATGDPLSADDVEQMGLDAGLRDL